jgi:hypothetical protein
VKLFATWNIPDELRNALLRHLDEFEVAHPGCRLEIFVENSPPVTTAEILREPDLSIAQVLERGGPDRPQLSPSERAMAALRGRSKAFHDALVARILDEEAALLEHLGGVVRDLSRRIRVRKARHQW